MTQLISQSKIDEASNSLGLKEISFIRDQYDHGLKVGIEFGFEKGVQFTLNEIQPLMIEFAEFAYKNYDYIERISNKNEWVWKKNNNCFTTQQNTQRIY